MRRTLILMLSLAACSAPVKVQTLAPVAPAVELQPYAGLETWTTTKDRRMAWWREARFGMFVHWGLYSAAGGAWNGKDYEQPYAEWIQNWASVPCSEYAAAMKPLFQPDEHCMDAWADLAREAGMKYAVMTVKHHEGFTLFNSAEPYSLENPITHGTNISPRGRDMAREFADTMRARNLKVGFYYSLLDWQHPDAYELSLPAYPREASARNHTKYLEYFHGHVRELLSNYGPLDVLWFDFSTQEQQGAAWGARDVLQLAHTLQPGIVVNNRLWDGLENRNGDFGTPEKYVPPTGLPGMDWEVNHTFNESYGYSAHDKKWKSGPDVLRLLVDVVSKGGNLLLNIGPDAHGRVPKPSMDALKFVGAWMRKNSESIYGTTASPFAKLPWGRCTRNGDVLYLHVFDWPEDGILHVPLTSKARSASLLASGENLKLDLQEGELVIRLPARAPHAVDSVIRLTLAEKPVVATPVERPAADGSLVLRAADASLHGTSMRIEQYEGIDNIGWWSNAEDFATWKIELKASQTYHLTAEIACPPATETNNIVVALDDGAALGLTLGRTSSWSDFRDVEIGSYTPGASRVYEVRLACRTKQAEAVANIRSIRFTPVK